MDPNPEPDAEPDGAIDASSDSYPWETTAVLPQDKAMGLELELIELEHERDEAEHEGGPTAPIDAEITEVLESLEETVDHITADEPDSQVDIHAPEAVDVIGQAEGLPDPTGHSSDSCA